MSSLCGLYLCIATVLLLGVASLATDSPPIQDAADRPQKAAQSSDNNCVNYNLVDATRNTDYFYTCCETLGEGTAKIDAKTKVLHSVFNVFKCFKCFNVFTVCEFELPLGSNKD